VLALPSAGTLIHRTSAATVVRSAALVVLLGFALVALGTALAVVPVVAVGLFCYGVGTGVWDVAMNVEGAEVERRLDRAIMPRFHAAFSLGTIIGAGLGIPVTALGLPLPVHLVVLAVLGVVLMVRVTASYLPAEEDPHSFTGPSAWLEPRTLAIGVMVLAFAVVEGSANDWLTLALIDGYDVPHWLGVAGYATFVTAMTLGRVAGPWVLARFGRAATLWATAAVAALGVVLVVLGSHPALVTAGILCWGLGASLGFPVGMSAAADDPARSAARVSVVSTIGYAAFLGGPPLLGYLGDHVGTLDAMLLVAVLMVPAAMTVFAAREPAADRR
jgi:fucose permease